MDLSLNLQKIIYDKIKEEINVFSFVEQNTNTPYASLNIKKINEEENFNYRINNLYFELSIFDKGKSNVNIINISKKIKNIILNLIGTDGANFEILDIKFDDTNINLFNEIDSVWNVILNFNLAVKEWKISQLEN